MIAHAVAIDPRRDGCHAGASLRSGQAAGMDEEADDVDKVTVVVDALIANGRGSSPGRRLSLFPDRGGNAVGDLRGVVDVVAGAFAVVEVGAATANPFCILISPLVSPSWRCHDIPGSPRLPMFATIRAKHRV